MEVVDHIERKLFERLTHNSCLQCLFFQWSQHPGVCHVWFILHLFDQFQLCHTWEACGFYEFFFVLLILPHKIRKKNPLNWTRLWAKKHCMYRKPDYDCWIWDKSMKFVLLSGRESKLSWKSSLWCKCFSASFSIFSQTLYYLWWRMSIG